MRLRSLIKNVLGEIPFSAEIHWALRKGKFDFRFNLKELEANLDQLIHDLESLPTAELSGKKVFIFVATHYWLEQAIQMGFAMTGLGDRVTVGYLATSSWSKGINRYDLRLQNIYAKSILQRTRPWLETISLVDVRGKRSLPKELQRNVGQVTFIDTQYVYQDENVSKDSPVHAMRRKCNQAAARTALAYLQKHRPDVVVIPNGMILEFGAVYEVARYLGIPTVTYEYGDAANHIWISRDLPVVRHATDELWEARKSIRLDDNQKRWLSAFFLRRQKPAADEDFIWLSQPADPQGGTGIRARLGLDSRPVVVLATNVLGDSLTLDRQVFSASMIEWLKRTITYFLGHPEVQLVIRIHPGETIMVGPASANEVVRQVLTNCPEHIHVIGARDPVNTYDLMEATDLGLVYVTTAGLEMAARGIPVIVGGRTHYRGRGFTLDPDTWENYFAMLDDTLVRLPYRLSREQLELAWMYAYLFFRVFPQPFPWHLAKRWQDYTERPLRYVLTDGLPLYSATFRYLTGERIPWSEIKQDEISPDIDVANSISMAGDYLRTQQEDEP
jgi:hypothetical protein